MTNTTELQAFDEAVEAETQKTSMAWVAAGALSGALGVGYAVYTLLAPGHAAAGTSNHDDPSPVALAAVGVPNQPAARTIAPGVAGRTAPSVLGASGAGEEEGSEAIVDSSARERTVGASQDEANAPAEYATDGAFFVQVASYRNKANADERAGALSTLGLPAHVFAYGGPGAGWWHAVRLGPFEKRADAEASRFRLGLGERKQAYVLPRSNGKYHVQIASLAKEDQAKAIAQSFAAQGHSTKISRVRMGGQRWYCVRIGPFDTREEALGYQALVKDIPGGKSEVIPFPPPPAVAARGR